MNNDSTIGITLTKDEAKLLVILTEYTGGHPERSLRGAADTLRKKVFQSLNDRDYDVYATLGIKTYSNEWNMIDKEYYAPDINIHFKDGSNK